MQENTPGIDFLFIVMNTIISKLTLHPAMHESKNISSLIP